MNHLLFFYSLSSIQTLNKHDIQIRWLLIFVKLLFSSYYCTNIYNEINIYREQKAARGVTFPLHLTRLCTHKHHSNNYQNHSAEDSNSPLPIDLVLKYTPSLPPSDIFAWVLKYS